MTDKSQKVAKILLAAGGAAIGIFLIAKYHKNILQKLTRVKNKVFYEFANLPRTNFTVEIINTPSECQKIIDNLKNHCKESSFPALGFDCEWVTVNNERRKVALIQLCSPQGLCALFRVCKFSNIPVELREILEDPGIIKAGVTPASDASYLLQDYAIKMNGTFDLRFLALLAQCKAEGLGKLSKSILNIELDKDWHVRCSDWEIETMGPIQIDYAAKDAFVAIEIFRKLYNSVRPGARDADSILRFCDNYTDVTFKNKLAQLNLDPGAGTSSSPDKRLLKKAKGDKLLRRAFSTRTSPLYRNCQLEAPDGDLLCTMDKKKAEWYVSKGLGTVIREEPYTVRLNFEPSGRAVGDVGEYYRTQKENRCVVCGKEDDLIRKNVVPHEYRKFFPNVMKDKTSHDILLMCLQCHQLSNISDLKMRQLLQAKCDAPLFGNIPKENHDAVKKLLAEQRLAKALVQQKNIPEPRREELRQLLKSAYPDEEIDDDFLTNLLTKQPIRLISSAGTHGELVVKKYAETEGLVSLEQKWRRHFLEEMQPRYLPELWDVNHNKNRLLIRASEGRVEPEELKTAGVDAVVEKKVPALSTAVIKNEDDVDSSSEYDFRSAAGSVNSSVRVDLDKTLTEDDRYFSDATSFYETIRSEGSTIDDFQSFSSSLTEKPDYDSDGSRTSLCSQELSDDSATEVEEDPVASMEM